MKDYAVIVSAARTPIGKFQGVFQDIEAADLGAAAIRGAREHAGVWQSEVDKVYMGHVYTAGRGQSPKRQAALKAGLLKKTPTVGIDAVCASGLEAIAAACRELTSPYGEAQIIAAGGMESMSHAAFLLPRERPEKLLGNSTLLRWALKTGVLTQEHLNKLEHIESLDRTEMLRLIEQFVKSLDKLVNLELYDTLVSDGLTDAYPPHRHMGTCAELCVKKYGFSRPELDEFAWLSHEYARRAQERKLFAEEIVPVRIHEQYVEQDEGVRATSIEKLAGLQPAFGGALTAGTSSQISDGAAALLLTTERHARRQGLPVLARILSIATHAQEPEWYTTAPIGAAERALKRAHLRVCDIDRFEVNEAFAPVPMAFARELIVPPNKINVRGGAIALGHPIGASGARIITTLVHILKQEHLHYGLAAVCNGGGEARAIVIENLEAS